MRCKNCKKKISRYARECPYCHTEISNQGNEIDSYLEQVDRLNEKEEKRIHNAKEKSERKNKEWGRLSKRTYQAVACLMVAVILSGISYQKKQNKWDLNQANFIYVSGDTMVAMDLDKNKKKTLAKYENGEVEDDWKRDILFTMNQAYHESKEKHCMYYAVEDDITSFELYKQDTDDIKSKPICIADRVSCVIYDDKDNMYYVNSTMDTITWYDGENKKEWSINNISNVEYVKEEDLLLITCTTMDRTSSSSRFYDAFVIYTIDLKTFELSETFTMTEYSYRYSSYSHSLYYIDKNILYQYDIKQKECNTIVKQVEGFAVEKQEYKECVYYTQYEVEHNNCYNFVIDEYADKDKDATQQTEEMKKRNQLRKLLKETEFNTLKSSLYCYEQGVSTKIADDIGDLSQWSSYYYVSIDAITVQQMYGIKKKYKMTEYGEETPDNVISYYTDNTDDTDDRTFITRDCFLYPESEKESDTITENQDAMTTVYYAEDYESCLVKNKELTDTTKTRKYIDEATSSKLSKIVGENTYYYDQEEKELRVRKTSEEKSNNDKVISKDLRAFGVLGSGMMLLMESKYAYDTPDLYTMDSSGNKKLVAKNVWGLVTPGIDWFDEDGYLYSTYYG